ncbi:hypothetical protein Aduo_012824 [Ancylostoma duodenale]
MNHVDVDQLLEDYAWSHFKDIQSLRKTRLDDFKSLERDDCEFIIVSMTCRRHVHLFKQNACTNQALCAFACSAFACLFGSASVEIVGPISNKTLITDACLVALITQRQRPARGRGFSLHFR